MRDGLYVEDLCSAISVVLARGRIGETYNIEVDSERTNLDVVRSICQTVNELLPKLPDDCGDLITYVRYRPGHDCRCAVEANKISNETVWQPLQVFELGIRNMV